MNHNINLIHLKFFCDVVDYESISEAAKMNYISQSAVSQAIRKLETLFGAELLFQNRQKMQVTDEGKLVYDQANIIFRNVQNLFEKIEQTKDISSGSLHFVTTKSLGMSFLAPLYRSIKQNLPHLNLTFRMGGLNVIRTALRREEAEFAIVVVDHNFDQFDKLLLKKGTLNLYQSVDADPKLIEKGIFIDSGLSLYGAEIKAHLEKLGHLNPIQQELASWDLTARFTDLNLGVGFFPDYILSKDRYPSIEQHPLEIPRFEYEICAIFNKGVKLSRTAQLFLKQFISEG
ncbi:MAG: LysR family transcriptional regulator [Chlamydiia bacterium]|nr:LysR family transcriptional regulator [Chlamydiia bacterium]